MEFVGPEASGLCRATSYKERGVAALCCHAPAAALSLSPAPLAPRSPAGACRSPDGASRYEWGGAASPARVETKGSVAAP
jgi:hypothetical protein